MHDPCTVAFEIRSPFRRDGVFKGYRPSLITIWHVDPERNAGERGTRSDDTCGWFSPPSTRADRERIHKAGESQYRTIFEKRSATQEGKDYARICYEPSTYDAVYWAWRHIKRETSRRQPIWQYGRELTRGELAYIYSLASNPVDNLRHIVAGVNSAEACGDFFLLVYRAFRRYWRPWYRHPRWHFWHWRIQVHPWQQFRRWLFSRCSHCGKRFAYGESPTSFGWHSPPTPWFGSEVGVYHGDCAGKVMAQGRAETEAKAARETGAIH